MTVHSLKMAAGNDDTELLDSPVVKFEKAWSTYPRRVAKKDAQKAWAKVDSKEHQKILLAIASQRKSESWRKDGGKFIPHFATWLNGERWNDELDADLSMGECSWNCNGNRGPEPKCTNAATVEKKGTAYCKRHGDQV